MTNKRKRYSAEFKAKVALEAMKEQKSVHAQLKIYDLLGNEIKTLIDSHQQPGFFSINWNGENNNGVKVSSSIYVCVLIIGRKCQIIKMLLIQ